MGACLPCPSKGHLGTGAEIIGAYNHAGLLRNPPKIQMSGALLYMDTVRKPMQVKKCLTPPFPRATNPSRRRAHRSTYFYPPKMIPFCSHPCAITVDTSLSGQCASGVLVAEDGTVEALWLSYLGERRAHTYKDVECH